MHTHTLLLGSTPNTTSQEKIREKEGMEEQQGEKKPVPTNHSGYP
jgi:hypothetical protein